MKDETILVVDDEPDMLRLLERILTTRANYRVLKHSDPYAALEELKKTRVHAAVVDLKMPGMDGIRFIQEAKTIQPDLEAIVLTAYGTIESAVEAVKKGAFDYITKPFKKERLLIALSRALEWRRILAENRSLKEIIGEQEENLGIVGSSEAICRVRAMIFQVAPTNATVLITGSSGTGKELVAQAIHRLSSRRSRRFVSINCAAIPESILESELFGYVRGAFTGAWKDRKGLIEEAQGGTLFLDEVGDMPMAVQAKLLRLLEHGEYRPLGSNELKKADVRIIAATNKNLEKAVEDKTFREDLYYRLKVFHIHVPDLDERKEDIPILSQFFLKKYAHLHGKPVRSLSPEALRLLVSRTWQGNVRELAHTIERAVILSTGEVLEREHLLSHQATRKTERDPGSPCKTLNREDAEEVSFILTLPFKDARNRIIRWFHRLYITSLLRRCGGNVSRAAELAGIQRQYLHQIMKEEGIQAQEFRSRESHQAGRTWNDDI
ncbi:sigma-54-dependent transcriptional regulator [Thermodesulforhabdus norvegica]|uniref:Two-component system, NtrC family, response regulator GlrR n=1 Tax=Thermodesulforhabdus norvegica TaxID=39841 RepID=A0A1I4SHE3_9BACT|nr:sigma-54 dependent transcriptional regulator [Thermodesulforhabdus norvegica]SFM63879.1 two-component system, NtrC family, response regulator GlrR [Thermodesulforhabdus norvegica]